MRKEIKKAPTIRFRGFTDDWEQRKLSKVVSVCSGMDYKHLSTGNIPVYGTGGYMLSVNKALSYDRDAIGIGRKGTIDKPYILRAPFWTVDTLFYAIPQNEACIDFVYDLFQNVNWKKKDESTGVPSLSKVAINNTNVIIPSEAEQRKIGSFTSQLDILLTLHQRKLDQLKKLKKYFLQNMFPTKGKKVPRIRFKGFTGDWEERKLRECAPIRGGFAFESKKFVNSGVPIIRISNILGDGNVGGEFTYYDEQNNDSQYILPDKALIMAMSGATTGKVGILDNPNNLKYYQNQRVGYFLQNDEYDYKFIGTFLRSNLFQNQLKEVLVSGAQPNISGNDINKLIINIPVSLAEQKQIGRIMELFDEIIAIHHRRLDQLQTMKKFMLQNMFI